MGARGATTPINYGDNAVVGLDAGRSRARQRAARHRAKDRIVTTVMFVLAGAIVATAAYYGYQFYMEEQQQPVFDTGPQPGRQADEIVEDLMEQPRWNGPGSPAFGVGEEQP
jgi:hypothetical protein